VQTPEQKILIAEDDLISRRLLESLLRKSGYDVQVALDGADAWAMLQEPDAPKLVILDWMMPGMDGLQICREIRKRNERLYTYILLLTAKSNRQELLEGLEAGADDYLVKPFDVHELRARLNVGRRILNLQNQLLYVCEELRLQATQDSLTGVWNRAAILEILEQELARASRDGTPVGIVLGDLDHFKRVNDTHGHPAGDTVLREATRSLRSQLRSYDALGRYGGEEFLFVLPGCNASGTVQFAERVRQHLAANPVGLEARSIPVTISLGASAYEGHPVADSMLLFQAADSALYRAKSAGRNRVEFYPPASRPEPDSGSLPVPNTSQAPVEPAASCQPLAAIEALLPAVCPPAVAVQQ
jgi:two-component system, cell cycle response regulator